MPELTDEGVEEQTAGLPSGDPGPAMATEQAEQGGEYVNVAPHNPKSGEFDPGPAVAEPELAGMSIVRLNRMTSAGTLLGLIGKHSRPLLELLAGFDPAHLQALLVHIVAYHAIPEYEKPKARVIRALQIFSVWSEMTPGDNDHHVTNWMGRILGNPGLAEDFAALVTDADSVSPASMKVLENTALSVGMTREELLQVAKATSSVIERLK